jgi:hypothetical protein
MAEEYFTILVLSILGSTDPLESGIVVDVDR